MSRVSSEVRPGVPGPGSLQQSRRAGMSRAPPSVWQSLWWIDIPTPPSTVPHSQAPQSAWSRPSRSSGSRVMAGGASPRAHSAARPSACRRGCRPVRRHPRPRAPSRSDRSWLADRVGALGEPRSYPSAPPAPGGHERSRPSRVASQGATRRRSARARGCGLRRAASGPGRSAMEVPIAPTPATFPREPRHRGPSGRRELTYDPIGTPSTPVSRPQQASVVVVDRQLHSAPPRSEVHVSHE